MLLKARVPDRNYGCFRVLAVFFASKELLASFLVLGPSIFHYYILAVKWFCCVCSNSVFFVGCMCLCSSSCLGHEKSGRKPETLHRPEIPDLPSRKISRARASEHQDVCKTSSAYKAIVEFFNCFAKDCGKKTIFELLCFLALGKDHQQFLDLEAKNKKYMLWRFTADQNCFEPQDRSSLSCKLLAFHNTNFWKIIEKVGPWGYF